MTSSSKYCFLRKTVVAFLVIFVLFCFNGTDQSAWAQETFPDKHSPTKWCKKNNATISIPKLIFETKAVSATNKPLSDFCANFEVSQIEPAGSEQSQPLYLGLTPFEMAQDVSPKKNPEIPDFMRKTAVKQAQEIRRSMGLDSVEFEIWPTEESGLRTWVFSRWRCDLNAPWKWLNQKDFEKLLKKYEDPCIPGPIFPRKIDLTSRKTISETFDDILQMKDLYDKPLFGNLVWTNLDGSSIFGAWLPISKREIHSAALKEKNTLSGCTTGWFLPQPPRFNFIPVTFVLKVSKTTTTWPINILWVKTPTLNNSLDNEQWPISFFQDYFKDIQIISGQREAIFPISGKHERFVRKNNIQPDNQLEDMADYLEERYKVLGLKPQRQQFFWRGIPHSNIIIKIKGSLPQRQNNPILMADHFDTAFAERVFEKTKQRQSAPGADDNSTAVAALLRAAEILRDSHPKHDIWLVNLTGEEYPADDLGARILSAELRNSKQNIGGIILMDMIGNNKTGNNLFQINPGNSLESLKIAELAFQISQKVAPKMTPVIRERFSPLSYLYNTDGLIFDREGFPIVLLNEEMNRLKTERNDYHNMDDLPSNIDLKYAATIAKVGIETARQLANR